MLSKIALNSRLVAKRSLRPTLVRPSTRLFASKDDEITRAVQAKEVNPVFSQ